MPRKPGTKRQPKTKALTPAQYDRLLQALARIIDEGDRRTHAAAGRELVRTYHALGRRLLAQKLAGHGRYGAAMIQRLGDDLDVPPRTLHRAMAFAKLYVDGPPNLALRWAHYRELSTLPDPKRRGWYEQQAIEQGWSAEKLREAIRDQLYRSRTEKQLLSAGKRSLLRRPVATRFGYKATVERVVDGDTLLTLIDLGFEVHKSQRLRLAGINTAERDTTEGARAKQFVEQELAGVEFIMLSTNRIDLYGRYIAHVFYAPGVTDKDRIFSEGLHLNQRLVDEGLAKPSLRFVD